MSEQTNFPIQPKKKLRVIIRDSFEEYTEDNSDFLLSQLDATEKNEQHIVRAVNSANESVPVPENIKIPEMEFEYLKSGVVFTAPERCFNYDSDFFDPLNYIADANDMEWVDNYNLNHKFLKVSIRDVELVFNTIEDLVKDMPPSEPKVAEVMHLLPNHSLPYQVIEDIYDHWQDKEKWKWNDQSGSVIKFREFPPDHFNLRTTTISNKKALCKIRKSLSDQDYIKRLYKELQNVQAERDKAISTLERQEEKQREDERMLREETRKIKKLLGDDPCLIQGPKMVQKRTFKETEQPKSLCQSTIPLPPTKPSFLKWCMKQNLPSE